MHSCITTITKDSYNANAMQSLHTRDVSC